MVFLNLNEKQRNKIVILNNYDDSIIKEFCRISIESISKDISQKVFLAAAQKLNIEVQDLKELIEIISWIMVENSRLSLNEKELTESLVIAGFKPELIEELVASARNTSIQIQSYIEDMKMETRSFNNLEWRVDVRLATRSLQRIIEPEIIFKLELRNNNNNPEKHILQTDPTNLVHLTNCLENALNEIKTNYCRRIFKNLV